MWNAQLQLSIIYRSTPSSKKQKAADTPGFSYTPGRVGTIVEVLSMTAFSLNDKSPPIVFDPAISDDDIVSGNVFLEYYKNADGIHAKRLDGPKTIHKVIRFSRYYVREFLSTFFQVPVQEYDDCFIQALIIVLENMGLLNNDLFKTEKITSNNLRDQVLEYIKLEKGGDEAVGPTLIDFHTRNKEFKSYNKTKYKDIEEHIESYQLFPDLSYIATHISKETVFVSSNDQESDTKRIIYILLEKDNSHALAEIQFMGSSWVFDSATGLFYSNIDDWTKINSKSIKDIKELFVFSKGSVFRKGETSSAFLKSLNEAGGSSSV